MLRLTILPMTRPSEAEMAANPLLYQQFVEVRTHSQALLARYAPDIPVFFKEAVEALGNVKFGPVVLELPDSEEEYINSQIDVKKTLEKV